MIGNGMREFYESHGPQETVGKWLEMLDDKATAVALADKFSLLEMAEAFRFPIRRSDWERIAMGLDPAHMPGVKREAVDFTAFPVISGKLLARGVFIPAYDRIPDMSSRCIGTEMNETKDPVRVPGWTAVGTLNLRMPGQSYEETDTSEKYVEVKMLEENQNAGPFGRMISLKEEDILFDQTGQLKTVAQGLGSAAANLREKEFFNRLADATGWQCYFPAGTRTDPYNTGTTSGSDTDGMTPRASLQASNALADYSDIQAADLLLSKAENERGEPIQINATHLIVPRALLYKARLATRQVTLEKKGAVGPVVPTAFLGGAGFEEIGDFEIVCSMWLDKNSATTWYYGAPRESWCRNWVYRPEMFGLALGPTDPEYRNTDTIYVVRARMWCRSFPRDYRHVIENTA